MNNEDVNKLETIISNEKKLKEVKKEYDNSTLDLIASEDKLYKSFIEEFTLDYLTYVDKTLNRKDISNLLNHKYDGMEMSVEDAMYYKYFVEFLSKPKIWIEEKETISKLAIDLTLARVDENKFYKRANGLDEDVESLYEIEAFENKLLVADNDSLYMDAIFKKFNDKEDKTLKDVVEVITSFNELNYYNETFNDKLALILVVNYCLRKAGYVMINPVIDTIASNFEYLTKTGEDIQEIFDMYDVLIKNLLVEYETRLRMIGK